ncbi:MAG: MFS transporter [Spirochaetaceae bacterium]
MRNNVKLLATVTISLIIIAQLLNTALTLSGFEETYTQSFQTKYENLSQTFKSSVERDVNLGKNIYLLNNVAPTIFNEIKSDDLSIKNLYILDQNRLISFSSDTEAVEMILGDESFPVYKDNPSTYDLLKTNVVDYKKSKFFISPVYYNNVSFRGYTVIEFEKNIINQYIFQLFIGSLPVSGLILVGALILLIIFLSLARNTFREDSTYKKRTFVSSLIILSTILIVQLTYTFYNQSYYRTSYLKTYNDTVTNLESYVEDEFEFVLGLGLPLESIKDAEFELQRNFLSYEMVDQMLITDKDGNIFYSVYGDIAYSSFVHGSDHEGAGNIKLISDEFNRLVSLEVDGELKGYLQIKLDSKAVNKALFDILLDALTILVVIFVFTYELIRLFLISMPDKKDKVEHKEVTEQKSLQVIRISSFLFFFAALIPISFLPDFIKQIYANDSINIFNLGRDTIISLPISAYMLGVAVFIPIVGFLSTKVKLKKIFQISITLFIVGTLLTAFSSNIIMLIVSRFIAGAGYGGVIINATSLVMSSTTSKNRALGFGFWAAGFASASITAIAIGGVIVNKLGFEAGLFLSIAFSIIFILVVQKTVKDSKQTVKKESTMSDLVIIFKNPSLVANLLFSSIPFSLAYIGLFQYVFPLYMSDKGISHSNIGRVLTVYGLISLLTPLISKIADKTKKEKNLIMIGNTITGLALISFYVLNKYFVDLPAILILIPALIGMGFGGSIIDAVEEVFITSTPEAQDIGETRLLSLYTTYDKMISVVVPILAGVLVSVFGYYTSIGMIGLFTFLGVFVFAIMSRNFKKNTGEVNA